MPQNKKEQFIFALITVIITVNAFVLYNLYFVNGALFRELTGELNVLYAINKLGGVYMIGDFRPIWAVILIEFLFAITLEMLLGQPSSFKLTLKLFDPKKTHPVLFETSVICATVGIMCPAMSFCAAWLYYPYYEGFNFITLLLNWFELVIFNFPFAFFMQLFFIQPLVRNIFKHTVVKAREKRVERA